MYHHLLESPKLGGAGLTALRLAKSLDHRTQGCRVWVPGDGPACEAAKELGLRTHIYDCAKITSPRKLHAALANLRIGRTLRRSGPGIVHVHSPMRYGALQLGLKLSGLKRAVHVQLEEDSAGLRWAFRRPPELIITCARYLVGYVRRTLPEQYQKRQRIVAVPNAVDTTLFYPGDKNKAKRKIGVPDGLPLILMLANLAPHKHQETAIRATAELKRRGLPVACWLAGIERDGTAYTTKLHSLIAELAVHDSVKLLGYRSDAPDLLRAADFFLLPSTHEGLPLSILEAQAAKVPVLTAPAQNHAGYADIVEALLKNREAYDRVAENSYQQVRREYDWGIYCDRIWSLYQELSAEPEANCPQPGSFSSS
jgi:glycosyltransferase involved in cell wall biosynthesis